MKLGNQLDLAWFTVSPQQMLAVVITTLRVVRTISVKNLKEIRKIIFKGEMGTQKDFPGIIKPPELPTIKNLSLVSFMGLL